MAPIDELPRPATMRITGLQIGSKAKAVKIWQPTYLMEQAVAAIKSLHRDYVSVQQFGRDDRLKGEPHFMIVWDIQGFREDARERLKMAEEHLNELRQMSKAEIETKAANEYRRQQSLLQDEIDRAETSAGRLSVSEHTLAVFQSASAVGEFGARLVTLLHNNVRHARTRCDSLAELREKLAKLKPKTADEWCSKELEHAENRLKTAVSGVQETNSEFLSNKREVLRFLRCVYT